MVQAIHGGRVERAHRFPRGEVARGHDDVIDVRARGPAPKGEAARVLLEAHTHAHLARPDRRAGARAGLADHGRKEFVLLAEHSAGRGLARQHHE
eukprot:scaffold87912_cov34-Phaeocystis_antarctica.AAC.1